MSRVTRNTALGVANNENKILIGKKSNIPTSTVGKRKALDDVAKKTTKRAAFGDITNASKNAPAETGKAGLKNQVKKMNINWTTFCITAFWNVMKNSKNSVQFYKDSIRNFYTRKILNN